MLGSVYEKRREVNISYYYFFFGGMYLIAVSIVIFATTLDYDFYRRALQTLGSDRSELQEKNWA